MVSVNGGQAVAQRYAQGRFTTTATGPKDRLQVFALRGGHNLTWSSRKPSAARPRRAWPGR